MFDTELNLPLDYSRKQVLAWLHEYLGVPPSEHCFRISMLVPKLRENGWRWELYEASNTKKWYFLVSKALERRYCNIMLVEFLFFFNNSILIINCKYSIWLPTGDLSATGEPTGSYRPSGRASASCVQVFLLPSQFRKHMERDREDQNRDKRKMPID